MRLTSVVLTSVLTGVWDLVSMICAMRRAAVSPRYCLGTWMVVSGGERYSHRGRSSKPITAMSSGMRYEALGVKGVDWA